MTKSTNKNRNIQGESLQQEAIMNRVNDTFDRISQDVKAMVHKSFKNN